LVDRNHGHGFFIFLFFLIFSNFKPNQSINFLKKECAEGEPPYMDYPPLRALFLITTKGIPDLESPEDWSSEFKDFIKKTLTKEPKDRPDASELLSHPFLNKAKDRKCVGQLVRKAKKLKEESEKLPF
jgi:serine/threonine protein kinase